MDWAWILEKFGPPIIGSLVGASFAYQFAIANSRNQFRRDMRLTALKDQVKNLDMARNKLDEALNLLIVINDQIRECQHVIKHEPKPVEPFVKATFEYFDTMDKLLAIIEELAAILDSLTFYQTLSDLGSENFEILSEAIENITNESTKLVNLKNVLIDLPGELQDLLNRILNELPELEQKIFNAQVAIAEHKLLVNEVDLTTLVNPSSRFFKKRQTQASKAHKARTLRIRRLVFEKQTTNQKKPTQRSSKK